MSVGTWLIRLSLGLGGLATLMSTKAADSVPIPAKSNRTLSAEDNASIQGVVAAFADSWNHHDMDAMHTIDIEDVEWINVTGNHWRGKADVRRGHTNIHRTICEKDTVKVDQTLVRLIAPSVAIAVATFRFASSDENAVPIYSATGKPMSVVKTRGSFVLVKRGRSWKIAQFQNTIVDPLAEEHDPVDWDKTGFDPRKQPQGGKP